MSTFFKIFYFFTAVNGLNHHTWIRGFSSELVRNVFFQISFNACRSSVFPIFVSGVHHFG